LFVFSSLLPACAWVFSINKQKENNQATNKPIKHFKVTSHDERAFYSLLDIAQRILDVTLPNFQ
jgi:hypothetical protein